jgi:hypothetical protein
VEKVVSAPRKPIVSIERSHGSTVTRSVKSVKRNPTTSAPLMFTTKVPHGNALGALRLTSPSRP